MSLRDRCLRPLGVNGQAGCFYSLDALAETGLPGIRRLPFTLRIVLESLLRNCDGTRVLEQDVRDLANWQPNAARTQEIPFVVGRIVLQDVAGIPFWETWPRCAARPLERGGRSKACARVSR